jgi:hypothetical protein
MTVAEALEILADHAAHQGEASKKQEEPPKKEGD